MKIHRSKVFWLLVLGLCGLLSVARAEFSFFLIDNFESGNADKWYKFGNLEMSVAKNPSVEAGRDTVAESCGDYSLKLRGRTDNWYVGGIGTDLRIDASAFSRIQLDLYGSDAGGKLKVELYDDDAGNPVVEVDPAKNWAPTKDDRWIAEIPVYGKGFTRISIPFSAFKLENPGTGNGIMNFDQKDGKNGLLKIQFVFLTGEQKGSAEVNIDNIILTY